MGDEQNVNSSVNEAGEVKGNIFLRVFGINLLIFFLYFIFAGFLSSILFRTGGGFITLLIFNPISINVVLGIIYNVKGDKRLGKAFLLSAVLLPIIAIGACFAMVFGFGLLGGL